MGGHDATNSHTFEVVSLFSRYPATYCVFLLEWFRVFIPGSGRAVGAPCQHCVLLLHGRKRTGTGITFGLFGFLPVHGNWELDVMRERGIKPCALGRGQE